MKIKMNAELCLKKLEYVGTLAFATVDEQGNPQVRCVSAIHYENDVIYFFTARGKNFYRELTATGRVQILGLTMYKEMIRLSGRTVCLEEETAEHWKDVIFAEQPYLENVYPQNTRDIGAIFMIKDAEIEYFNLGVNPIFRETYPLGTGVASPKGYCITDLCIGCGKCARGCPQHAIDAGTPYVIRQNNCLHCGRCYRDCPVKAVKRLSS